MKTYKILRFIDYIFFTAFMVCLAIIIILFGRGNIGSDSIDYYAITQRLTSVNSTPIVSNLHFVEQRAPGYPILSLIPYTIISFLVEPFVQTENISMKSQFSDSSFPMQNSTEEKIMQNSTEKASTEEKIMQNSTEKASTEEKIMQDSTEKASTEENIMQDSTEETIFPSERILIRDIFFKNFYIETEDSWFEWKIMLSMLITSYTFLFLGLIFLVKLLSIENKPILGISIIPFIIVTARIFMHNIVNTPTYATLVAFGISSFFVYYFLKGFIEKKSLPQFLSGLFVGLLVITRLETIVIAIVVMVSFIFLKEFKFFKNYILGALAPCFILLSYNYSQFGDIIHLGVLKGDVNLLLINWSYIYASLLNPRSGILFWSPLVSIGLIGLFINNNIYTKILGVSSLLFICLIIVRIPIMYLCIGEGIKKIGGLPIMCCNNMREALNLVCFDTNRYIVALIPFSVIGFSNVVQSTLKLLGKIFYRPEPKLWG